MMTTGVEMEDDASLLVEKGLNVVKYTDASLVMKIDTDEDDDSPVKDIEFGSFESSGRAGTGYPAVPKLPGLIHYNNYPCDSLFSTRELEFMLDGMFPNKVWIDGNKIMGKSVTTQQASRYELIYLKDELSYKENYLGIDKRGPSKMKVQLNLRCLDELVRQDTLNCAERGIFLKEIRDFLAFQFKMYQRMMRDATLMCRRAIQKTEEDETVNTLYKERAIIVHEIDELSKELENKEVIYESLEREYTCQEEAIAKVREDEIVAIRKCNLNMLSMLEVVNPDCRALHEIRETMTLARKTMVATIDGP